MQRKKWYAEGLSFACTQCGKCCRGAPGYVWVTKREARELAALLELDEASFAKRYLRKIGRRTSLIEKPNFDCVFWENGCSVYEARPSQCRSYPFWPEVLRSRGDWEAETDECPGMGTGQFYPLEAIERIRHGEGDAASEASGEGGTARGANDAAGS